MKKFRIASAVLAGVMVFSGAAALPGIGSAAGIEADAANATISAPQDLKAASITMDSVKLTWKASKGADAYRVTVMNLVTGSTYDYADVKTGSCTITGLETGKSYKFIVTPLIKMSSIYVKHSQSSSIQVKTLGVSNYDGLNKISVTAKTDTTVDLSWGYVNSAYKYRVYKYDSSKKKYYKYKDVKSTTVSVTGLKPETSYKFLIGVLLENPNQLGTYTLKRGTKSLTVKTKAEPTAEDYMLPDFGSSKTTLDKYLEHNDGYAFFNVDNEFYMILEYAGAGTSAFNTAIKNVTSELGKQTSSINAGDRTIYLWKNADGHTVEFVVKFVRDNNIVLHGKADLDLTPDKYIRGNDRDTIGNLAWLYFNVIDTNGRKYTEG